MVDLVDRSSYLRCRLTVIAPTASTLQAVPYHVLLVYVPVVVTDVMICTYYIRTTPVRYIQDTSTMPELIFVRYCE